MADWQYKGINGPIDQGHVNFPEVQADENSASAYLMNRKGEQLHLWVDDVTASFEMGTSTGQSKHRRSLWPRSFVQPKFTVHGQMANSLQYQRLAEFVREAHLDMLQNASLKPQEMMALHIGQGGQPGVSDRQKGHHQGYHMRGYISKIDRGAERWVNAPTFQFEFTLAYSYEGLFSTGQAIVNDLASWSDVFLKHGSFTEDPDSKYVGGPLEDGASSGGGGSAAAPDGSGGLRPT